MRMGRIVPIGLAATVIAVGVFAIATASARSSSDINTQPVGSNPGPFVQLGNRVLFPATDSSHGTQLWATNGTLSGTRIINAIPGTGPRGLTRAGKLVFFGEIGRDGGELWVTDGTAAGTRLIRSGLGETEPPFASMVAVGNMVYFDTWGPTSSALWRSDGTRAGTRFVHSIAPPPRQGDGPPYIGPQLVASARNVFFAKYSPWTGLELWKSDGSSKGTTLVKDVNAGLASSDPYDLTAVGRTLYFAADDGRHGRQLWRSNGTARGTWLVKDIGPASGSDFSRSSFPNGLTPVGSERYFAACSGSSRGKSCIDGGGSELWKTDGTTRGTARVAIIGRGCCNPIEDLTYFPPASESGTKLLFSAHGSHRYQLWRTNGTKAGTRPLTAVSGPDGFFPSDITPLSGGSRPVALFVGNLGRGLALWRTDGSWRGTRLVKAISLRRGGAYPQYLTRVSLNGKPLLLMEADDGIHGPELWRSDGSAAGTFALRGISKG